MTLNIRKKVLIFLIVLFIIVFEITVISVKLNYFNITNRENLAIKDYNEKYIIESIVDSYLSLLSNSFENYNEASNVFTEGAKISKKDIKKILQEYDFKNYSYLLNIESIVKTSHDQYNIKYSLIYESEALADGYVEGGINQKDISEKLYNNEVIISVRGDKYKVLYNKIDLGGGNYYEK